MTTVFLSAGEVSGDMHGAHLARALLALRPDLTLVGVGGPRMAEAGVRVIADVTRHSAVGLTEQLPHVLPVARAFRQARKVLAELRPDVVVLIDYQGANLALAKHARALGLRTVYYIAPQDWLWSLPGGGPAKVAAATDHLLAVFEREAQVYRAAGGRVTYIGHPLVDIVGVDDRPEPSPGADCVVALLPGSRAQEVARLLPTFLEAARLLARPGLRFVLPAATPALEAVAAPLVRASGLEVELTSGGSLAALRAASAALVASGTATLEAVLCDVPCVAAYRVSGLTAWLARRLLRVRHVTLPNIVADRQVIPELLQGEARPERMAAELARLLDNEEAREAMRHGYAEVRQRLGPPGAIGRGAREILDEVSVLSCEAIESPAVR